MYKKGNKMKIILLASMILFTPLIALTVKVEEPTLVKGTSVGKYLKPGAPVDIKYETQHVSPGDISDIHIVLISNSITGTMKVKMKVDKGLDEVSSVEKHLSFDLNEGKKEYPIDLQVSADEDGVYYIKLLISIKGKGMRAFAVPVYVGDGMLKTKKTVVEKTEQGENISVSPAEETITKE